MESNQDNKTIAGIINGDQIIIKAFYKNNLSCVQGYILQNSGSEEDAKDIFQDAMMIIYQKSILGQLELHTSLQSYFYGVCKNLWRSRLRRKNKMVKNHLIVDCQKDEPATIWQDLEGQERQDIFYKYFLKLSDSSKELLRLFFEGKSMREISKITGYTEGYARKKKCDSKNYLRRMMEKDPVYKELVSA